MGENRVFLRAQLAGLRKSHFQQNVSLEEDKRLGWKARSGSILISFHKHGRHAVVFCESSQKCFEFYSAFDSFD